MANQMENRDTRVLDAAVACALENGYQWITRDEVAKRAGCSTGTVNSAYGTMVDLKRAVLRAAVERELVEIVAQGLADRHPIALEAPIELKEKAAALVVG